MRATLSCRELAQATMSGALGQMLARLGAALDLRESHRDPETLSQLIEHERNGVDPIG